VQGAGRTFCSGARGAGSTFCSGARGAGRAFCSGGARILLGGAGHGVQVCGPVRPCPPCRNQPLDEGSELLLLHPLRLRGVAELEILFSCALSAPIFFASVQSSALRSCSLSAVLWYDIISPPGIASPSRSERRREVREGDGGAAAPSLNPGAALPLSFAVACSGPAAPPRACSLLLRCLPGLRRTLCWSWVRSLPASLGARTCSRLLPR
jgi:hypothetical protein